MNIYICGSFTLPLSATFCDPSVMFTSCFLSSSLFLFPLSVAAIDLFDCNSSVLCNFYIGQTLNEVTSSIYDICRLTLQLINELAAFEFGV